MADCLLKQAGQDIGKRPATCFVAIEDQNNVTGYYTLSSKSLGREQIPDAYLNRVPKKSQRSCCFIGAAVQNGSMAVVVDLINSFAVAFYKKYGFELLPSSQSMFLPMQVIGQLM